jgi:hypothetical protein
MGTAAVNIDWHLEVVYRLLVWELKPKLDFVNLRLVCAVKLLESRVAFTGLEA